MPSWPAILRSIPANETLKIKFETTSDGGKSLLCYGPFHPGTRWQLPGRRHHPHINPGFTVRATSVRIKPAVTRPPTAALPAVQSVENHRGFMFRIGRWSGRFG